MNVRAPTDLGLLLRERRRALGLDQRELAARVGVSRQWIIEIEKGKPRADLSLVLRTLNALGLVLDVHPLARTELSKKSHRSKLGARKQLPPPPEVDIDQVIERTRGKR